MACADVLSPRMKISRTIRLWAAAIRANGMSPALRAIPFALAALCAGRLVSGARYRARLRACGRCEIYDRKLRICRRGELGCGCSSPVKFLFENYSCWARENRIVGEGIGWPEHVE